jgi:hypothetical protein
LQIISQALTLMFQNTLMRKLVFFLLTICTLHACKKSSDNSTPAVPTGNYIKIDNDIRQLGDIPSGDISWIESPYPEGPLVSVIINNRGVNIDNSQNQYLLLTISLFEGSTATSQYKIENVSVHSPATASINVLLQGNTDIKGMNGKAGTLYVTRDENNKIKSFKFENVVMDGTYDATVSCNIVVK